jgi:hypothetical protein
MFATSKSSKSSTLPALLLTALQIDFTGQASTLPTCLG